MLVGEIQWKGTFIAIFYGIIDLSRLKIDVKIWLYKKGVRFKVRFNFLTREVRLKIRNAQNVNNRN